MSPVCWDDEVDAVLAGDLTAALGYRTPAGGVVVQAVAPVAMRDREHGTIGFTTSLGFSKKLERIARDPRVAMAFHAREHGASRSGLYVLVQGTARVIEQPTAQERQRIRERATAQLGPPAEGPFWNRWLREYYQPRLIGLETRQYTGWLDASLYAPHTETGYRAPANKTLLLLLNGLLAKRGVRTAAR